LIGRREHPSYLSGMALIVSDGLDLGIAPEQVVNLFPAVMIRVNHSLHLSQNTLRETRVNKLAPRGRRK